MVSKNPEFDYFWINSKFIKKIISKNVEIKSFPLPEYDIRKDGTKIIKNFKQPEKNLKIEKGAFLLKNAPNDNGADGYDDLLYITFGYLISL